MDTFKKILDDVDEVDLTPMIDVTFLLLIYFMVTTMIKQPEAELSLELPGQAKSSLQDVQPMKRITLEVDDGGSVTLDGTPSPDAPASTDREQRWLLAKLQQIKEQRDMLISSGARSKEEAEPKVDIKSSGICSWQAPLTVLNACSGAGINKVAPVWN